MEFVCCETSNQPIQALQAFPGARSPIVYFWQGLVRAVCPMQLAFKQTKALQRVLYSVYAIVKLHFVKKEEVYLPILDQRLTSESAQEMFEAMEAAAHKAKHTAH